MPRKCRASSTTWCVVDAALDDGVHLDAEAGRGGGGDAVEHAADREADVVHGAERLVVERVEADGDALEAGRDERLGLLRQQRAVRRQRDVEAAERRQALDQHLEVAAQERLAARDPDLLDAVRDERAREPLDLLEAEQLLAVHEAVAATEHLLGHAVDAAEVAAVGDRDPEVADRPAQGVQSCCRSWSSLAQGTPLRVPEAAGPIGQ